MANEPKEISDGTWWIWFGISIFVYVLGLLLLMIPVAGEILSEFLDWISFGALALWCHMSGVNYTGKNKTLIFGAIVGMIPVINDILPEMAVSIWYIRKGHKKQQKVSAETKVQEKNNVAEMQKYQGQQNSNLKKAA
jgi:hypothetical protein